MTIILRCRTTLSYGAGGPGLVTHYYRPATVGGSNADATACANGVRAFWVLLAPYLANNASALVQPSLDAIDDATGQLSGGYSATPPAIVPGTGVAPFLPVFTSGVVRYNTTGIVHQRRVEGRSFVGPLAGSSAGQTSPAVGFGTAATAAVAALIAAGPGVMVVWARPFAGSTGNPARTGGSYAITGGSLWSSFGSLRSRRD